MLFLQFIIIFLWIKGKHLFPFQYGSQLKENYDNLLRDIAEEDLENLANARSFSISSMAKHANNPASNYSSKVADKVLDLDQVSRNLKILNILKKVAYKIDSLWTLKVLKNYTYFILVGRYLSVLNLLFFLKS